MKRKIDKFVTDNYDKLIRIAQSKVTYFDRPTTAEAILADAYIYIVNNPPEDVKDIPRHMVNYMNLELRFNKSNTTRRDRLNSREIIDTGESTSIDIDAIDLKDQLEAFRKTLDRVHQIVWDVYSKKGKRKIIEIAEHFNINMSSAYQYRTRVINEFKKHNEDKS